MVTNIGPSTVEAVAVRDSTRYPFQRKGFYAKGYHFEFYYAGNQLKWRRSVDGITWGSSTNIIPATEGEGAEIAVCLDRHEEPAQRVHVAYAAHDADSILYYRRGTIDDTGALTWDAAWQTAVAEEVGVSFRNLTICVDDTNGYPFIGYTQTLRANPPSDSKPKVTHCQTGTGTWTTLGTFPETLNTTNDESWVCVVVPYNGVYVMAIYARDSDPIRYDIYDIGGSWTGETATAVTMGSDATKLSVTSQRAGRVTAKDPRRVHAAFCDTNEDLKHISIDDGGVTGPTLIYNSATAMGPSISTRIYGGDALDPRENPFRTLYVFWSPFNQDEPAADIVCYKKSIDAGATWTKEDGSIGVEQWRNETGDGLSGTNIMSSYFEEQHHFKVTGGISLPESYIGVVYTNKGASPDYVRWAGLEFADPDEDLLCNATIKNASSKELLGKAETKQPASADLLGKIAWLALPKVELLANFVVGQDSQALFGKTDIQKAGSAEAYGHLIIRNIGSAELSAKVTIRHVGTPRELLGKLIVRYDGAVELLGRFEAQATAELLGKVIITHSDELYARFRTSTPAWAIQGASVEAYIDRSIVV